MFNRKERLQISKKLKSSKQRSLKNNNINWRKLNNEKKRQREEQILEELDERRRNSELEKPAEQSTKPQFGNQKTWYSLNVALPGSILNNIQTKELKAYVLGQLARSFAIFCVDEIVIFDENAQIEQSQIDDYYNGNWSGEEPMRENNSECNFHMARIFEYLECPQYLRRELFPIHDSLKFAGLLNPLDAMHHLRSNNLELPYREGIVLEKSAKNDQQRCNVGLDRDLILTNSPEWIEPKTRITIKIFNQNQGSKKLKGTLTDAKTIRQEAGVYWGYSVRIAKSLSDVLCQENDYDFVIGTSERGSPISELAIPSKQNCKILIVFGGLAGLEAAINADTAIEQSNPAKYFQNYINCLPDQGSRIIRTEEAIPICLTALKCKLDGKNCC